MLFGGLVNIRDCIAPRKHSGRRSAAAGAVEANLKSWESGSLDRSRKHCIEAKYSYGNYLSSRVVARHDVDRMQMNEVCSRGGR